MLKKTRKKIMNKSYISFVILLIFSGIAFAQSKEELKEFALRDAEIVSDATLKMDFETVFKYTLPSVIDMMGGKEKGIAFLTTTFDKMASEGFVFEKAEVVSASEVVFEQDEYRCYVEGFNQMVYNNMRIKAKSYMLGIYNTDKKVWSFIEAKQLKNSDMADMVLPNFTTALEIPDDEMVTEQL